MISLVSEEDRVMGFVGMQFWVGYYFLSCGV